MSPSLVKPLRLDLLKVKIDRDFEGPTAISIFVHVQVCWISRNGCHQLLGKLVQLLYTAAKEIWKSCNDMP